MTTALVLGGELTELAHELEDLSFTLAPGSNADVAWEAAAILRRVAADVYTGAMDTERGIFWRDSGRLTVEVLSSHVDVN